MNKGNLLTMLLLLVEVSMYAQSISTNQMDERFNDGKMPYGWFAEGWVVKDSVAQKASSSKDMTEMFGGTPTTQNDSTESTGTPTFNMNDLMGGGETSYNYLMTPPLSVSSGETLVFSAKKGAGGSDGIGSFMGGGSDSTFVVERSVYGEHKWIKVADFTTALDSVYKTFTISNTAAGEYRFRFRAGGNVMIDSVAGFHIDMAAPDIYPVYQGKNIQPVDLGLCKVDTTATFSIINTGTGTLDVNLTVDANPIYTLDISTASIAAADTAKVNLTFNFAKGHEGRNSAMLTFAASDERIEKIPLPIDAVISQAGVWVEDFNQNTKPVGWFTEGWEVKDNVATVKSGGGGDMMSMFGGSSQTYYLMTPPLKVNDVNDVLLFSVKKPGGSGGMDFSSMMGGGGSSSSFFVEKSVYGSGKWEKIKDFSNAVDTIFTTQWLSGIEPGEYRFRFLASDSIVIDSIAGFQIDMEAPDLYVTLDSAVVKSLSLGLLTADSTKTFTVMNTGTGTLKVNAISSDNTRLSIKDASISVAAGDSVMVGATMLRDEERQGEFSAYLTFIPGDERLAGQTIAMSAYVIKSDAWSENFEPDFVAEDQTYPRRFPEGWSSTGWLITEGGNDDLMSMFGGGSTEEKSWVAKTESKEYEMITPRLQANKGNLLQFTAQMGGAGGMMQLFGMGGGSVSYLNVYYKRDKDKDWTYYNSFFTGGTVVFKAPYSGFYQLKFEGEGVSLDNFLGFSLPKESISISDQSDMASYLETVDGQTWNVEYDRKLSARVNGDGSISPVAATVCLPYDFNIDDYYESGVAKVYQMEYIDATYNQFIFREMPSNMLEAGKPYMVLVNRGEVQFNAVDAKMTSKVAEGIPVYDFADWWWNMKKTDVATWNGTFDSFYGGDNEYALQDNGVWERLQSTSWISPFRACLHANTSLESASYRQNPNTQVYDDQSTEESNAKGLATRFYQSDADGNGEVAEIPNLLYVGDINGNSTTAIRPTIQTIDRDGTRNYFDLQGRRLNGEPDKGIYIENGKKHMVR